LSFLGYAQNKTAELNKKNILIEKTDSLFLVFKSQNNDSIKINTLNEIFKELNKVTSDTLLKFYNKYEPYISKKATFEQIYSANSTIGYFGQITGKFNLSLEKFTVNLKQSIANNDTARIANAYGNIGNSYFNLNQIKDAILAYNNALEIFETTKNTRGLASIYGVLGNLYLQNEDYKTAISNYKKSKKHFKTLNSKYGIATSNMNIGIVYRNLKEYEKSLSYFKKAETIYSEIKYNIGLALIYGNIGNLHFEFGNHKKALFYQKKCFLITKELGIKKNMVKSLAFITDYYISMNKPNKAIEYGLMALNSAKKNSFTNSTNEIYEKLYIAYKKQNKFNEALKFLELSKKSKDSISEIERKNNIDKLLTEFETKEKEKEITLLKKDAKIKSLEIEKKDNRIKTTTIILIIILLFTIISMVLYFQKRASYLLLVEQNVKLTKSDIEKEGTSKIEISETAKAIEKYSETKLDASQKKELIDSIIILMEEEKYFLNTQFTINDFAKELQSNRNYLSKIINEYFNTNFNNFVNEFRVKEARKLLLSNKYENYTIEGIANSVGFHSKATFNNAFKKFTGVTPSFFKNNTQSL